MHYAEGAWWLVRMGVRLRTDSHKQARAQEVICVGETCEDPASPFASSAAGDYTASFSVFHF